MIFLWSICLQSFSSSSSSFIFFHLFFPFFHRFFFFSFFFGNLCEGEQAVAGGAGRLDGRGQRSNAALVTQQRGVPQHGVGPGPAVGHQPRDKRHFAAGSFELGAGGAGWRRARFAAAAAVRHRRPCLRVIERRIAHAKVKNSPLLLGQQTTQHLVWPLIKKLRGKGGKK